MSKINKWLPWLTLFLIVAGQLYYLPERLTFLQQSLTYAHLSDSRQLARLAYGAASYDLLQWVEQNTSPSTTLLLVTASPRTYGDPAYVLYHRALYHLYPRSVWWAAPVSSTRYPAWWIYSDLSQTSLLDIARKHQASAILADGFAQPPVSGPSLAFEADTSLIFLDEKTFSTPLKTGETIPSTEQDFSFFGQIKLYLLALLALGFIWLWGDILYRFILGPVLPPSPARRLAIGWLLGSGITSLGTFLLLWTGLSLLTAVITLSLSGCLLWIFLPHKSWRGISPAPLPPCPPAPLQSLFILILTLQIGLIAFAAWASPLTDWDAWVNWAGKANAVFIDQTLSSNLYNNPARLPTNMDYPLLLPLTEAWFYTWLGHIHEPVLNLISLLFYAALLFLFYHASHLFVSSLPALGFTVLLATLPRLERPAFSGLADIPLAAFVFLSFLLLIELFRKPPPLRRCAPAPPSTSPSSGSGRSSGRSLLSLAFVTGCLPWLKNEGWLWWGLVSLSLLIGLVLQVKRNDLPVRLAISSFLIYFLPALLIPLLWQGFLTIFGTYRFTFLPLTPATFWTNLPRLPLIAWHLFTRMLNPYWNFIWLLAGLAVLSRRQRVLSAPAGWLILPILGYMGLVGLSYVFSRFDPFLDHLNNSAERLLLQAAPLVLLWLLGQSVTLGWVRSKSGELKELRE